MCSPFGGLGGCVRDAVGAGAQDVAAAGANAGLSGFSSWISEAAEWAIENLATLWLSLPNPDVGDASGPTVWLQERLWYFVAAAMMASIFYVAFQLATQQTSAQPIRNLGEVIMRVVIVSSAGLFLITLAVRIGDEFAAWIIEAAGVDLGGELALTATMHPGAVLVFAFIILLVQFVQVVMMIIRHAAIIYLSALLPLAAASSASEGGKQWWTKTVAWLIAFILYKPAAAFIYAGAFMMLEGENDLMTQLTGVVAMVMAIAALPALMKLLVPATASLAGGNAAGTVMGLGAAAAATGAMVMTSGMSSAAMGFSGSGSAAMASSAGGGGGGRSGADPTGGDQSPPAPSSGDGGGSSDNGPSGADGASGKGTDGAGGSDGADGINPPGAGSEGGSGGSGSAGAAVSAGTHAADEAISTTNQVIEEQ